MVQIGITERGDAAIDTTWKTWVYEKGLPAILITKDPVKLITENPGLFIGDELKGNVILHATITGMGGTWLEPNVPNPNDTLKRLQLFLDEPKFHRERIVIRQDPIFVPELLDDFTRGDDVFKVGTFAKKNGLRYRMSFLDLYPHVKERISQANPDKYKEILKTQPDMHLPLNTRLDFLKILEKRTGLAEADIEICGEPEIKCTGCLSKRDLDTFGVELDKDPETGFQRPACACLGIKKELLTNKHRCKHQCVYCFWKD